MSQSFVHTRAIGKLPPFGGDVDPNGSARRNALVAVELHLPQLHWSVRSWRNTTLAASGDGSGGPTSG